MQDAAPLTASPARSKAAADGRLALFTAALFLAVTTAVLLAILARTGGVLIYSLDDPYIHLALAERIRLGHYGINLGEVSSPSSSVLWPFLLVPGAGTTLHASLPFLLNVVLGFLTALLIGRLVAELPLAADLSWDAPMRLGLAALLLLASNVVGLVFTGMEHNLQVLLALAAAMGLIEAWRGRPIPAWALAAVALGPVVRYELLAVTAAMAVVLVSRRQWRSAAAIAVASLLPLAAFALFLHASGSSPLPNSVLTKLSETRSADASLLAMLIPRTWQQDIVQKAVLWAILGGLVAVAARTTGTRRWIAVAAAGAAILHLAFGRFGWFFRYEVYAVVFCGVIALRAICELFPREGMMAAAFAAALYACAMLPAIVRTPGGAHNIYDQHYQMHRFVAHHYKRPVAVNDLGWVSYRLDPSIHVLDLWGLASNEALRQRRKSPEWLDEITRRHATGLAIVYRQAFREIPASWTPVGALDLSGARVTAAFERVMFYATGVGDAAGIRAKLAQFKPTLPAGVRLEIIGDQDGKR